MENGLPLHATTNSVSPFKPKFAVVTGFGLGAAIVVPVVMVGGKFKFSQWGRLVGKIRPRS